MELLHEVQKRKRKRKKLEEKKCGRSCITQVVTGDVEIEMVYSLSSLSSAINSYFPMLFENSLLIWDITTQNLPYVWYIHYLHLDML